MIDPNEVRRSSAVARVPVKIPSGLPSSADDALGVCWEKHGRSVPVSREGKVTRENRKFLREGAVYQASAMTILLLAVPR
jgi:hypothetical protein